MKAIAQLGGLALTTWLVCWLFGYAIVKLFDMWFGRGASSMP